MHEDTVPRRKRTRPLFVLDDVGPQKRLSRTDARSPGKTVSRAAAGKLAVSAFALGALACGACAIGALAVGRLAVRRARFGRLEIDELTVGRLRVKDG